MKREATISSPCAVHVTQGEDCATAVWSHPSAGIFLVTVRNGSFDAEVLHLDGKVTEIRMRAAALKALSGNRQAPRASSRPRSPVTHHGWGHASMIGNSVSRAEEAGGASAKAISDMFARVRDMSPAEAVDAFARYSERRAASSPCRDAGRAAA